LPVLTNCFADDPEALETGKRSAGDSVLCLVVAPSQELAMQIVRNAQALVGPAARHLVAQCIGGANTRRQLEALKRGKPVMVVGTPGRLAELSLLGHLRTHHVRWLVLDEADELLGPVFVRHLTRLGEHAGKAVRQDEPGSTGSGRATILVSATMAPATLTAYAPWCANPALVRATTAREQQGGDGEEGTDKPQDAHDPPPALPKQLRHMYVRVNDSRMRVDALRRAIHALDAQRALVFLNFGRRLQDASAKLAARGMAVGSLHGGQSKLERGNTLQAFRTGKLRALLVTDLAARGLDVPECDAVFNLELPSDGTHYAHRAGRTARADQPGICVTLVEASNEFVVRKFERALGVEIQEAKVGGGEMLPMAEVMNRVANSDATDAPTPAPAPRKPAGIKFYKPKGAGRKAKVGSA
jgi:superfamily II DNA/RNA helicase